MDKVIGGIVEAAKFVAKHAPGFWLVAAVVLFVPAGWLAPLDIASLVAQYRPALFVFFLVTSAFLLTPALTAATVWGKREWAWRRKAAHGYQHLHHLTAQEKEVLSEYVREQKRVAYFDLGNGVVESLVGRGILYRPTNFGDRWKQQFAYNLSDWAFAYLMAHPELVEAGRGSADKDEAYSF